MSGAIRMIARSLRGIGKNTALFFALLVGLLMIVFSPYLLLVIGRVPADWVKVGNVGQAYGGVSALLSGLALVAVTASILYQRRQMRYEVAKGTRERHADLIRMAIDNPLLFRVLDTELSEDPDGVQILYANLWMGLWHALWSQRLMGDEALRLYLTKLFRSPAARRWWEGAGTTWLPWHTRSDRRFRSLVDDVCLRGPRTANPAGIDVASIARVDQRDLLVEPYPSPRRPVD